MYKMQENSPLNAEEISRRKRALQEMQESRARSESIINFWRKIMKKKTATYKDFDRKFSGIPKKDRHYITERWCGIKALFITILVQVAFFVMFNEPTEPVMLSPIPEAEAMEVKATPTPTPDQFLPRASVDEYPTHTGIASYYSRSGCVGCSPTMTMANGKPLDDSALTVAFNRAKLGTKVRITNEKNGQSVVAIVTDRGGFEKPKFNVNGKQRIVDMTIATKDAINCSHLCEVKVEVL